MLHGFKDFITRGNDATFIDIGAVINAVIVFLITAAVVYFMFVVPSNRLAQRRARTDEPKPTVVAEDVVVLREILGLLQERNSQP